MPLLPVRSRFCRVRPVGGGEAEPRAERGMPGAPTILADDTRIVGDAGGTGVAGPAIGFGGRAGSEIGGEKGVQAGGRVIGDLVEPDTAGTAAAVLNLDRTDNQHFALMAAPAATGERIVFAAASDIGFINLDQAGKRASAPRQDIARGKRFIAEALLELDQGGSRKVGHLSHRQQLCS
jgi:hypothetical protein